MFGFPITMKCTKSSFWLWECIQQTLAIYAHSQCLLFLCLFNTWPVRSNFTLIFSIDAGELGSQHGMDGLVFQISRIQIQIQMPTQIQTHIQKQICREHRYKYWYKFLGNKARSLGEMGSRSRYRRGSCRLFTESPSSCPLWVNLPPVRQLPARLLVIGKSRAVWSSLLQYPT